MDPVGSWSAYQSAYNRIAVANAYSNPEFQHHLPSANTPSSSSPALYSTNGQLIHPSSTNQSFVQHSTNNTAGGPSHTSNISSGFNPNNFLSPPPVGHYDQVFPTIYHPHPTKPSSSYYRPPSNNAKTIHSDSSTNYPTSQNYIEQPSWTHQPGSSFGVLPHETVPADAAATHPGVGVAPVAEPATNSFNAQQFFKSSFPQQSNSGGPILPPPPSFVPLSSNSTATNPALLANGQINSVINNSHHLQTQQGGQSYNFNCRQSFLKTHANKQVPFQFSKGIYNYPERPDSLESRSSSQSSPVSFAMDNSRQLNSTNNNSLIIKKPIVQNQAHSQYMPNYMNYDNRQHESSTYPDKIIPITEPLITKKPSPLEVNHQPSLLNQNSSNSFAGYQNALDGYSSPSSTSLHQIGFPNNISSSELYKKSSLHQRIQEDPINIDPKDSISNNLQLNGMKNSSDYDSLSQNNNQIYSTISTKSVIQYHSKQKRKDISLNKSDDYYNNAPQYEPKTEINEPSLNAPQFTTYVPKTEIIEASLNPPSVGPFYGDYERCNPSTAQPHHEALGQPASQPSPPYVASAPPNDTSAHPFSETSIQTNPSQLQKQSQTVASITHTEPQLSPLSPPSKTQNTSTEETESPTPPSNPTADPHLSNPPPSLPIRHLDSSGPSKSSMNRVVVPDIEKELNFLKYQEVKSPAKLALNNTNNGFIDCFVKFLKGKNIEPPQLNNLKTENNGISSDSLDTHKSYAGSTKSDSTNEDDNSSKEESTRENETKKSLKRKKVPEETQPRRTLARRKAKEISQMQIRLKMAEEEENNSSHSDIDPAWSPGASSDDGLPLNKRVRVTRSSTSTKSRKKIEKPSTDESTNEEAKLDKRVRTRSRAKSNVINGNQEEIPNQNIELKSKEQTEVVAENPKVLADKSNVSAENSKLDDNSKSPATNEGEPSSRTSSPILSRFNKIDDSDFKSGEFVILKADGAKKDPPIWRIDGRSLLQKYESFKKDGEVLYKNISTYSSWTLQSKNLYQKVNVRYRFQSRTETIVEFLSEEGGAFSSFSITPQESEAIDQKMNEFLSFQDNFDIYIQTLISQALDSTFLSEVLQENDEYFLNNVNAIDKAASQRLERILGVAQWSQETNLTLAVSTWPCFNILTELTPSELKNNCASCDQSSDRRIQLYGQPYNANTLEGCPPDPRALSEKDFLLCLNCLQLLSLCNKVAHQKYRLYVECAKRVGEMRVDVKLKDTIILNNLLADEEWNTKLFKEVRMTWAEIDIRHEQYSKEKSQKTP